MRKARDSGATHSRCECSRWCAGSLLGGSPPTARSRPWPDDPARARAVGNIMRGCSKPGRPVPPRHRRGRPARRVRRQRDAETRTAGGRGHHRRRRPSPRAQPRQMAQTSRRQGDGQAVTAELGTGRRLRLRYRLPRLYNGPMLRLATFGGQTMKQVDYVGALIVAGAMAIAAQAPRGRNRQAEGHTVSEDAAGDGTFSCRAGRRNRARFGAFREGREGRWQTARRGHVSSAAHRTTRVTAGQGPVRRPGAVGGVSTGRSGQGPRGRDHRSRRQKSARSKKTLRRGSNGSKVETLKGGDFVRVWINKGGNHYLLHLPTA